MMTKEGLTKLKISWTPGQGYLRGHMLIVKMPYSFFSRREVFFSTAEYRSNKSITYRDDDQGRVYQKCKFRIPQNKGCCAHSYIVKMLNFCKNVLFYSWAPDILTICSILQIWLPDIHHTLKDNRYYACIPNVISSLVYYNNTRLASRPIPFCGPNTIFPC